MKKILISLIIGIIIGAVGMGIVGTQVFNLFGGAPKITNTYINGIIKDASDLNSAVLCHSGLVTYEQGKIPFINKKSFGMKYTANIRAGVDIEEIDIDVSEEKKTVTVDLPEPEIQSMEIDPDSIEFVDEKFVLLKGNEKEDVTKAISEAKKDAKKKAGIPELLDRAADNAEEMISGLLKPAIGNYDLVIK